MCKCRDDIKGKYCKLCRPVKIKRGPKKTIARRRHHRKKMPCRLKQPSLNTKQKQFCKEYIIDLNQTRAAKRAGYSDRSAASIGQKLIRKDLVIELIQELMDKRSERVEITADRVLQELGKMAFSSLKNLKKDGKMLDIEEMDDMVAASIQEITEESMGGKDDPVILKRKYKLYDKKGSLELLGKHLKLFTDKIELSNDPDNPISLPQVIQIEGVEIEKKDEG